MLQDYKFKKELKNKVLQILHNKDVQKKFEILNFMQQRDYSFIEKKINLFFKSVTLLKYKEVCSLYKNTYIQITT